MTIVGIPTCSASLTNKSFGLVVVDVAVVAVAVVVSSSVVEGVVGVLVGSGMAVVVLFSDMEGVMSRLRLRNNISILSILKFGRLDCLFMSGFVKCTSYLLNRRV